MVCDHDVVMMFDHDDGIMGHGHINAGLRSCLISVFEYFSFRVVVFLCFVRSYTFIDFYYLMLMLIDMGVSLILWFYMAVFRPWH